MNDRELLEFAANAAGMWKDLFSLDDDYNPIWDDENGFYLARGRGWWNPLIYDGDAFRLQVYLKMDVTIGTSVKAVCVNDHIEGGFARVVLEISNDQYQCEVARRAIVMAAAEVGKEMK